MDILREVLVKDVHRQDVPMIVLPEDMTFAQLRRLITTIHESFFPVVDDAFRLRGVLSLPEPRNMMFEDSVLDLPVLRDLVQPTTSVSLDDNLSDALLKFLETGYSQIPIQDAQMGVFGILHMEDVLACYNCEIQKLSED